MPGTSAILCCRCKKDVSATKRVKNARGQDFCEPCYKVVMNQRAAPAKVGAAKSAVAAPPPPPPVTARPPQRVAAPVAQAAESAAPAAAKPLPARCPACDAPVMPGRRICLRCNRDVTKLDKLIAMKAAHGKVTTDERIGNIVGKVMKIGVILVVIGSIAFIGYGGWLMFKPMSMFDTYPTKRVDAVNQILADIAEGTDKSYEKAFELISFNMRFTNNEHENLLYRHVYTQMHDDFLQKYGADWLTKAKVENEDPGSADEVVPFTVTVNDDVYHVLVQAQIPREQVIENMMTRRDTPQYFENGKRHFGVLEIEEYTVHPRPKMEGGPGKVEPLPTLKDFHPNGQ